MTLRLDIDHTAGAFRLRVNVATGVGLTALVGPSGAGKTTLLNIIAGVIRPERGSVVLGDDVLVDTARGIWRTAQERRIGYVFQTPRLFPHFSVRSNLLYGQPSASEIPHRFVFGEIVDLLALGRLLARMPRRLSGGEAQRVALGRALLSQPRLLLLDEPLASVDQARRDEVLPYLDRLRKEAAMPTVYVTHTPGDIKFRADQIISLDGGLVSSPLGID